MQSISTSVSFSTPLILNSSIFSSPSPKHGVFPGNTIIIFTDKSSLTPSRSHTPNLHPSFPSADKWSKSQPFGPNSIVGCNKPVLSQQSDRPSSLSSPQHLPSLYPSWRSPRWLSSPTRSIRNEPPSSLSQNSELDPRASFVIKPPSGSMLLRKSTYTTSIKVFYALIISTFVPGLFLAYARFNSFSRNLISCAVQNTLDRPIHVGRVSRFNPFTGVRLVNVVLPQSDKYPTAPIISAKYVDVTLSGVMQALTSKQPLNLDVRLSQATIKVSQKVLINSRSEPFGFWDPGLPTPPPSLPPSVPSSPSTLPPSTLITSTSSFNPCSFTRQAPLSSDDITFTSYIRAARLDKLLRFIQPGTLSVRNAFVTLQPAKFLDYGHGDEAVQFKNASADVTFPHLELLSSFDRGSNSPVPYVLNGDFQASVKGTPLEGGSIFMTCSANGDTLLDLKPEEPVVNMRVVGKGVRSDRVASFLSLPFRADDGRCGANIELDFLYQSDSNVPIMSGEATLNDVALRFHPDPKTPEFKRINGTLRFDGKVMHMDDCSGSLGTLPMSIDGSIHLEDGYNLEGYVHPVDVNNILDTFEVEKFVPIQGSVYGHIKLNGPLEEPFLSGEADTIAGCNPVFDRLPLESARMTFNWDAVAGVLKYPKIDATVKGGGTVTGTGSMYFDMTKENEWDIRSEQHHERNPKAVYWNTGSTDTRCLPAPPEDDMEIDEYAPCRQYDSMVFSFRAADVDGGDLLYHFGGEYGIMARNSLGRVSGDAVIAGHLKDANCRVLWKTTSPPPEVKVLTPATSKLDGDIIEMSASDNQRKQTLEISSSKASKKSQLIATASSDQFSISDNEGFSLGGGDFSGLVHIKLGDPPEARRVKARTIVQGFDARRAGWEDEDLRRILKHTPHLLTSMDTFFKGVMFQQPIVPPGATKLPRTPRMKMLGIDGAVAVRGLKMNNLHFKNVMSGSFGFGTSDFSMSLNQVITRLKTEEDHWELAYEGPSTSREQPKNTEPVVRNRTDQLTVILSLSGDSEVEFRHGESELVGSLKHESDGKHTASMSCKNINVQDFVGQHLLASGSDALKGTVDAHFNADINNHSGGGEVIVRDAALGPLQLSSIGSEVQLNGSNIHLKNGWVNYRSSAYELNSTYTPLSSSSSTDDFVSSVDIGIRRATFQDISKLVQEISSIGKALLKYPGDEEREVSTVDSLSPFWLQNLVRAKEHDDEMPTTSRWDIPSSLSASEKAEWSLRIAEERKELKRIGRLKKKKRRSDSAIFGKNGSLIVDGAVSGKVRVNYNSSKSDEPVPQSESKDAVVQMVLDQMARTSFIISLVGDDCRIGDVPLRNVTASGLYEDGVLNIGPVSFEGERNFGAEATTRITRAGGVDGSLVVRHAPSSLVQRFSQTPVQLSGDCSGRLEVEGNLSNPRVLGRMVWTDATLNGKPVRDARSDLACVNGRCLLNVDAKIGGRRHSREQSDKQRLESLNWGENVTDELKDLAIRTSNREYMDSRHKSSRRRGRGRNNERAINEEKRITEDGLQIRVSAPVRFYLLNYLRKRAESSSSSVWTYIEPVLGTSFPSDDEWIIVNVDMKKYGLILLNSIAPQVGWEGGDSDVMLRISGSVKQPVVSGKINISDGRMSPSVLEECVTGVKGEVVIGENGVLSLRSISGRCAGKWIMAGGDMFLTKWHEEQTQQKLDNDEAEFEKLSMGRDGQQPSRWGVGKRNRLKKRVVLTRVNHSKSLLQRAAKGISLEFGDIGIDLHKALVTKISGRMTVNGVFAKPVLSGSLNLSDGIVFLGNVGSASSKNISNGGNGEKLPSATVTPQKLIAKSDQSSTQSTRIMDYKVGDAVEFNKFRVSVGRNVKVVQSFLLNLQTTGDVTLNGMSNDPDMQGHMRLVKGSVNLLASRMRVSRGESSYVKLVGRDAWQEEGLSGDAEVMMRLVMENDHLIVRIGECRLSNWLDSIQVRNKRRDLYYGGDETHDEWNEEFRSREDNGSSTRLVRRVERYDMKKMVINSLLRIGQLGGKFGKVEWRLFPVVVSKLNERLVDDEVRLKEDLGGGGRIDIGGFSVSAEKSMNGCAEGKLEIRLGRWGRLRFGANGKFLTTDMDLFGRLGGGKQNKPDTQAGKRRGENDLGVVEKPAG